MGEDRIEWILADDYETLVVNGVRVAANHRIGGRDAVEAVLKTLGLDGVKIAETRFESTDEKYDECEDEWDLEECVTRDYMDYCAQFPTRGEVAR